MAWLKEIIRKIIKEELKDTDKLFTMDLVREAQSIVMQQRFGEVDYCRGKVDQYKVEMSGFKRELEFIRSEEFIDSIVERIQRKQL